MAATADALAAWARTFVEEHGRRPSRADMPADIGELCVCVLVEGEGAGGRAQLETAPPLHNTMRAPDPSSARALVDYGARSEPPAGGVPPSPEAGARAARPAAAVPPPPPLADTTNNPFLRRKPPPRAEPLVEATTVVPDTARSVERGPVAAAARPRPSAAPAPRRPSFVGRPPFIDGGGGDRSPLKPPPGLDVVPRSPLRVLAAVTAAAVAVPQRARRAGPPPPQPQPQQPQQPLPAPADRKRKAGAEASTSAAPAKRPAAAVADAEVAAAPPSTSAPPPPPTTTTTAAAVAHFRHVIKPPRATRGKATATRDNFVRINLRGGGGASAKQRYIGRKQQPAGRGGGARARARASRAAPPPSPTRGWGPNWRMEVVAPPCAASSVGRGATLRPSVGGCWRTGVQRRRRRARLSPRRPCRRRLHPSPPMPR